MAPAQRSLGDLVSHTIDSVVNGVSQQPAIVRLPSQAEAQDNMISKVVEGVSRRPPTEFVATLHASAIPSDGYKSHIRNRDANTQHLVLIEDGDIRVWNLLTGVEATVEGLALGGYISELTGTKTDETAEANEATADDMNLLPAATVTSASYFGAAERFNEIELTIGTTPGTGTYTLTWEYSTGAGTWSALSVTDGTGSFKNGSAKNDITFTTPSDWEKATYESIEKYWVRAQYAAGTITQNPLGTQAWIGSKSYLGIAGTDASQAFAITSVADYSFIVNKETVVEMSGSTSAARENEFLIYVFESCPAAPHVWSHTLGTTTFEAGFNPVFGSSNSIPPGEIAHDLVQDVYDVSEFPLWSSELVGQTVVHVWQTTGNGLFIGTPSWEYSDETYSFIGARAQKFSDLPPRAPDGFLTEVTGGDGNEDNNYWVEFDDALGAWVEAVAPDQDDTLDNTTMPHVLIQTSVGGGGSGEDEFTFGPQTWDDRGVGDIDTAPEPSFVGKTISDIFFHKNRLGFCADESTILSEAGKFFNFWPTTVTTLVDSDPIDAANTSTRVALIDYAIPWDEKLYLFSGHTGIQNVLQASTGASAGLTNANAEVVEASAFPSSKKAQPINVGKGIFFAVDKVVATGAMEYSIIDNVADAFDIASHVPTYIPGDVKQISASLQESIMTLLSGDQTDRVFVYSFFYNDGKKVQSSWSRWIFDDDYDILGAEWVGTRLYLTVSRTDGLHLEYIDTTKLVDGNLDHRVHLDSLTEATGVYTVADNTTRWTMPYASAPTTYGTSRAILTATAHGTEKGRMIPLTYEAATQKMTAEGDHSAGAAHLGRVYSHAYEFTKPIITAQGPNRSSSPITQGRLQINKWKVITRNSGGFECRVTTSEVNESEVVIAEDEYVYYAPDKIMNAGTVSPMHPRAVDTFEFDVGVESKYARVSLTGSSHLPCTLVGGEWEGVYSARSNRV